MARASLPPCNGGASLLVWSAVGNVVAAHPELPVPEGEADTTQITAHLIIYTSLSATGKLNMHSV